MFPARRADALHREHVHVDHHIGYNTGATMRARNQREFANAARLRTAPWHNDRADLPVKIREVIKMPEDDGWTLARQRGSHRQFKHGSKPGLVTVAGSPGDDLAPGTLNSPQAGGTEAMKYLIVIEKTGTGYSAYSPDVPGCVAAGESREEVEREMKGAIAFHLDGLRQAGRQLPQSSTSAAYVEVPI